jgi:acyl-coenzyme A synthetase/AMP-(fatty) acid ligase
MLPCDRLSLWNAASSSGDLGARSLCGLHETVALSDLERGSIFCGRLEEFCGLSVLLVTQDQLTAALALLELDGVARRLVLYPADLPFSHAPSVAAQADADAIVTDYPLREFTGLPVQLSMRCNSALAAAKPDRAATHETEWILLTSGTTGSPKMAAHTLRSLAGAIDRGGPTSPTVWSTFYDIRRYGGLQIFLRAILGGATLVLSSADESTADFLIRAGDHQVTHISGTPSHWRRALMTPSARSLAPQYVRLSGEIADQSILNSVQAFYPRAKVAHAFATTEAGVAFEVRDGLAGFPAGFVKERNSAVEMKIEDGSLRIRSDRMAARYLGTESQSLRGRDGFIDTGDLIELRGDRYFFVGRKDGVINVGGLKVHPEEVEAVINSHPRVRMSLVRSRKSPITGALVVADVVPRAWDQTGESTRQLEMEIRQLCWEELPRHKAPAVIRFVPSLPIAASGKLERCDA